MSSMDDVPIRARIPADLDTPDQLLAGLSAHQVAVLAGAGVPVFGAWQVLAGRVPLPVLGAITALVAALAVAVALGRRDGLSLDRWLLAALVHHWHPRRLVPGANRGRLPAWAPPDTGTSRRPAPLRLPVDAVDEQGTLTTGPSSATVLVAAGTVTAGLHTPGEQAALVAGFARWLHSLSGPVQIVVSTRRVDLGARALHLAETAQHLPHPALAQAAVQHADYLLDLSEDGDLLTRTVTIACTASAAGTGIGASQASTGIGAGAEAARRAARTVAALAALGARCALLNAGEVTAVLAAAADPFAPGDVSRPASPPGATVTARPGARAQIIAGLRDGPHPAHGEHRHGHRDEGLPWLGRGDVRDDPGGGWLR